MRALLDTSYLYDFMEAPGQFSDAERRFFADHEAQLFVSVVSIWEMRLKYQARHPSGERKNLFAPNDVVAAIAALEEQDVTFLPMVVSHATRILETPLNHKDPFDELLLVQAQEEGLKLLTVDRRIIGHPLAITV